MPVYNELTNQTDSSSTRRPLPGDEDYRAKILEVTEELRPDFTTKEPKLTWSIKFDITSFADGAPLEDIDGNAVDGSRWAWKNVNPLANGFTAAGEPSAKRQFLLAAHGLIDPTSVIPAGDTDELIGREVVLTLRCKPAANGQLKNYITAMKPLTRRRSGRTDGTPTQAGNPTAVSDVSDSNRREVGGHSATRTSEPANIDPAYLKAVASLVNDTDEPTELELSDVATRVSGR